MKTPREILLERHRAATPQLDLRREQALATALPPRERPDTARRAAGEWRFADVVVFLWQQLIAPSRRTWGVLGTAWLVIFTLHFLSPEDAPRRGPGPGASSPQILALLREQKRQMADLAELSPVEPADRPRWVPGPRSALRPSFLVG